MSILPRPATPVLPTPAAPACPARRLAPLQRQAVAVAALAGASPATPLAQDYQVSRKFV